MAVGAIAIRPARYAVRRVPIYVAPLAGAGDDRTVRITYDPEVDAAYIYLTDEQLPPGRDSVPADPPEGIQADIVLDWKDGKMVGSKSWAPPRFSTPTCWHGPSARARRKAGASSRQKRMCPRVA